VSPRNFGLRENTVFRGRESEGGREALRCAQDDDCLPNLVPRPLMPQPMPTSYHIAVIGCGDLHYDDALSVPLSSINQHSRRIGQEAARIALAILNSKVPPKPENVVLQPELVARKSTQCHSTKAIGRQKART